MESGVWLPEHVAEALCEGGCAAGEPVGVIEGDPVCDAERDPEREDPKLGVCVVLAPCDPVPVDAAERVTVAEDVSESVEA